MSNHKDQLTTSKSVRNADSLNPKKNPAMRRQFSRTSPGVPITRGSAVKSPRPRLRGQLSKPPAFDLTAFQNAAHKANSVRTDKVPQPGAFGGVTTSARTLRENLRQAAAKHAA